MGRSAPQFVVDVDNAMLTEALIAAASRHGWDRASTRSEDTVLVTDRCAARVVGMPPGNHAVLVCEPTSYAARRALDAVSELRVAAVVCADQPADLTSALDGMRVGRVSIPLRVLELAARMPCITPRQTAVLAAVVAGQTNAEIGRGLYLSTASVKREMAVLYAALGAPNRPGLAASARHLGVPSCPARP